MRYQDRLALSDTGAVAIFSIYVGGILLALLFAGRSSDRFGRRPIVVPFTILSGVGSAIMIVGRDELLWLFAGRFLLGLVSGATLSVGTAWLNELAGVTDERSRLRLAGSVTLLLYVGFGFGPITSALWDRWLPAPLVWPYVVHLGSCVLAAIALRGLPETKRPDPAVSLRPRLGVPPAARRDVVRLLAPASVWVFGFPSVSFALLPVVLRDAIGGSDVIVSGAIGSLTATAVLLARPLIARVGDARPALGVGACIGVAGYVIGTTAFVTSAWWLAPASAVLLGAASGILMNAGLAITESIADDANRGTLSATFYLLAYSGMTMPLVLTGVGATTSTTTALVGVTLVAAAAAVWIVVEGRRVETTRQAVTSPA
ncbi:MAG: MFS transporter [Actinomycetota bacterium]